MPNLNGTGPYGRGRGQGRRFLGGRNVVGSEKKCVCKSCGFEETQVRGVPCSEKKCPKCGAPMSGEFCL